MMSPTSRRIHALAVCLLLLMISGASSFYVPGVNPRSFTEGQEVKLKVNKLTSEKVLFDMDYYQLPFCQPREGVQMDHENLGELLEGDRIESSPYLLQMKQDMYCEQVCITNLGRGEAKGIQPNRVVRSIHKEYHHNWIVDNLDAAGKTENDEYVVTRYSGGFPVGFVRESDKKAYINNHVNIEIQYHSVEGLQEAHRIVRFTVEPFSIKHMFEPLSEADIDTDSFLPRYARITNPIPSCNPTRKPRDHTSYDMIQSQGWQPQEASGKVLFTYDVTWTENRDLSWANRWDIYLSMDIRPPGFGWGSFFRDIVVVMVLASLLVAVAVKVLRDAKHYNSIPLTDDDERPESVYQRWMGGWKELDRDVFRPPTHAPMLLAVFSATGAQLLTTYILTIIFGVLGFLNPSRRGHLVMMQVLLFSLSGIVSGFLSTRVYRLFGGPNGSRNTRLTAFLFPGVCFVALFLANMAALFEYSTDVLSFATIINLVFLWLGICTPLTFLGSYLGYRGPPPELPIPARDAARPIPQQPFALRWFGSVMVCGLVVGWITCSELYRIFFSVWFGHIYYSFGLLLLKSFLWLLIIAGLATLMNFYQLTKEDHRWWWKSFANGGAVAFWAMIYSFFYFFSDLGFASLSAMVFFFSYTIAACFGIFLMTGSVGLFAAFWFNKHLYSSIPASDGFFDSPTHPLFEIGNHEELLLTEVQGEKTNDSNQDTPPNL